MSALISDGIFHVLILEDWQVDFHMGSRLSVALSAAVWNLQIYQTLMTSLKKLTTNFGHSWIHDLVKAKVIGVGQPIGLVTSGCSPGLVVMLDLIHGMMPYGYTWAPPIVQQLLGASFLTGTHPNCGSLMVVVQGELSMDIWVLWVQCILQWWPEWSTTGWPSPRLTALVLSWACLPTQLMAPNSVNVASCNLPKLSLLLIIASQPGPVTTASVRPDLPSQGMSSTTGACQVYEGGGVVPLYLVEITCISKQYQV